MPLLDHFHPPLSQERHWESFHAAWIGSLADALNRTLPSGYFAEEQVHAGPGVEIDVATQEGRSALGGASPNGGARRRQLPPPGRRPPRRGLCRRSSRTISRCACSLREPGRPW
jgi:hypothetical protein